MKPSHYPSDNIIALVQLLGWRMTVDSYGATVMFDNPSRWYIFAGAAADGKWRSWIKKVQLAEEKLRS